MPIEAYFVHSILIRSFATTTDRYGDSAIAVTQATDRSARGWLGPPTVAQLTVDGRNEQRIERILRMPLGSEISPNDQVVVDGLVYELDGPPWIAQSKLGGDHLAARLLAVEG